MLERITLKSSKPLFWLTTLLCTAMLSACSIPDLEKFQEVIHVKTLINNNHSLIQKDLNSPYTTVYFIRPKSEHPAGFADNVLDVEVETEQLLKLGKGEYTLVYLKPREISITLRNTTQRRGRWEIAEMSGTRQFNLKEGATYFIVAEMIDGEFRGIHFIPESISKYDAQKLTRHLIPVGAARQHKIAEL